MQETGKVFYKLICVDSHVWDAEAHSLTCTVAVMDSGPFFCIQPLAGVLGTATGHWCFRAGCFLTWLTSVMTSSCCDWIWSTGWFLQRHPSYFSLCNLQTQIFCSTVMQAQGMTVYPQSTVAIGLAGGRSAAVPSRLFLCWLFLVVFQQVCILWLLAPCYLVLPPLYFYSPPILAHFYYLHLFPQSNLTVHAQRHTTSRDFSWSLGALLEMALLLCLPPGPFHIFLCQSMNPAD